MTKLVKTYIAGHSGLVGSALMRMLSKQNGLELVYKNSSSLDLRRQSDVEEFFKEQQIENVYLAAAKVGGILANSTYKADFIYDNLAIALNVVHAAYKNGVKKLLNLGSSCIYPKFAAQPITEGSLLTSMLEPTNEPYAIAKIAAVKLCRYYNEQYGTNYISVMPTNLYGPRDNYNLETAHVLPAMIRKFHLGKLLSGKDFGALVADLKATPLGFGHSSNWETMSEREIVSVLGNLGISDEKVLLWGTGEVYREFMHVDDLATACIFLMENCDSSDIGEVVNVGTGNDLKLKDLARKIQKVVGYPGEIVYDSSKPDGTPRKMLDVSKISKLGWKPSISLEEGLSSSYKAYCEKQN